jgi:hypothetical protein
MVDIKHDYSKHNLFHTGYKVWCFTFNLPKYGYKINEWLQEYYMKKYGISGSQYIKSCDWVTIVRKWYLKEYGKR